MKCYMQIFNINSVNVQKQNFKSAKPYGNKSNYQQYLEKHAYIESKTKSLDNLSSLSFIAALALDVHHIEELNKKLKTKQKFGIAALALSCLALTAKWIKAYKLSKQYDNDMKNHSTNNIYAG